MRLWFALAVLAGSCMPWTALARTYQSYRDCTWAYQAKYRLVISAGVYEPVWRSRCLDEKCRAERDVQCVLDAVFHRDVPSTMGFPTRREADVAGNAYDARIAAFGEEHPKRIPLYCAALVARTRRAVRNIDNGANGSMIESTTELAARLDRPGQPCLEQVLAAIPRTPAAAKLIEEARGYCYAARPVCDRIRLPGAP